MFSFDELIRYGFPGYLLVAAGLTSAWAHHVIPFAHQGTINTIAATAVTLVVGPFIGYLIHQIYFLFFDSLESYDKTRRACVRAISDIAKREVPRGADLTEKGREKLAYASWKFVMTNMGNNKNISEVFLRRLSSLHSYQHAFGSIIVATILSMGILIPTLDPSHGSRWAAVAGYSLLLGMAVMFVIKRRDIVARADLFERVAVIRLQDEFRSFMVSVMEGSHIVPIIPEWAPQEVSGNAPVGVSSTQADCNVTPSPAALHAPQDGENSNDPEK